MEIELEPRVKPLTFKVKAVSRESPSQKAAHVLDSDLRTYWSTGTNTKEWILLELDEPGLLSHMRIYNKSVLEWEISVGLRYKPETFVKARPRCEAPRRDMVYPINYTPCRYVRISCLRGNPIAIFFIQLIGVSMTGLEPEFQPVVNCLLPHIMAHKQDAHDMRLQLLQDMTSRLLFFLPQLEADLASFSDAPDANLRFLAMLAGPFYPILHIVKEKESAKSSGNIPDPEGSRSSQLSSPLTVSSNFEPRRSRGPYALPTSSSLVFRPDAIFVLLRKAYKDPDLGTVCRMAARVLHKLLEPTTVQETSIPSPEATSSFLDEQSKSELSNPILLVDYSNLFGDEFKTPDDHWDSSYLNILDIGAVEEGILHVLYGCASQPLLCSKFAGCTFGFWSALPLVQALLPALRPCVSSPPDHVDGTFSQWKQQFVQQALSQIISTASASSFHPLLHACAGYLSSFSPSHVKAACVLIDLCSGVLAPWLAQVVAKVDLTMELLEDLLGTIQGVYSSLNYTRARAALKYIVLALSGHMDDILAKYKDVKHRILFLMEMLERFLDPAITAITSATAFRDLSLLPVGKREPTCAIALNIIRTAVQKSAVLPSLESEWRLGTVAPSVLLSILEPRMQLPSEIDLCKPSVFKASEQESSNLSSISSAGHHGGASSKSNSQDDVDGKIDTVVAQKVDISEDASLFFAASELNSINLANIYKNSGNKSSNSCHGDVSLEGDGVEKHSIHQFQNGSVLDADFVFECFNMHVDYMQLMNHKNCELRASEFRRLAFDLHMQDEISPESHEASVDALLLAAECYVNPFFMAPIKSSPMVSQMKNAPRKIPQNYGFSDLKNAFEGINSNLETVSLLERERDKIVLQILLEAAELDITYKKKITDGGCCPYYTEENDEKLINLSPPDAKSADAITLARQNQTLLCNFLIQQLQREQHSMHEILMQSLLFFLHSATKLFCGPEHVIHVILSSAEYLNGLLSSLYNQFREGSLQLDPEKVHSIQRRWTLLRQLVVASSGSDEGPELSFSGVNNGFRYENLIPPSAWIQKIPMFSSSAFPLVRFLGWMAVSRNAEQYLKERFFFAPTLSQLTNMLSIFADDLALVDNIVNIKDGDVKIEQPLKVIHDPQISKVLEQPCQQNRDQSFCTLYPELNKFFPSMRKQFDAFKEVILEVAGLQLRSFSSSLLPDILCWFSDLCSWPFFQNDKLAARNNLDRYKGYVGKNAKAIIHYILEAIVVEHMEALVPEIPRVVQVLVSLCKTSYCDVPFLGSILQLLMPIISYSLNKISDEERQLNDDSCLNFESLCFDELFSNIGNKNENQDSAAGSVHSRALTIYILALVFPDLSFRRKRDFLSSLVVQADFANHEPTASFHDFLAAFQTVMESCEGLLVHTLRVFNVIPLQTSHLSDVGADAFSDSNLRSHSWFLCDVFNTTFPNKDSQKPGASEDDAVILSQKFSHLSAEEIGYFTRELESVISNLFPTIELCWKLHHHLAKKLILTMARCLMFVRCLSFTSQKVLDDDTENHPPSNIVDQFQVEWGISLEALCKSILALQESHCWEVSSLLLDCVLGVAESICLNNVVGTICAAIKNFSCSSPKIVWRLQTDKWLLVLFARGLGSLHDGEASLIDLFCTLMGLPEPEQRFIALRHLRRLVGGQGLDVETLLSSTFGNKLVSPDLFVFISEPVLSHLVTSTWDQVALVASSDTSLFLRAHAMALLVDYIPFADRRQLQSFLVAADSILYGLGKLTHPTCEGPLTQLSLALISCACLYSPTEDISLIPESVWGNIETMAMSKSEGRLEDLEKKACHALCRLKTEGDEAKQALKEALCSSGSKEYDPDFGNTRESILQVIANLTSVQSYLDFFSNKADQEVMALEEAEIEMDVIQKEYAPKESSQDSKEKIRGYTKDDNRLQQIKDAIRSIEKSKLQEDILARRQKKILMRRARQKYLEEAALREAELLQELDRERAAEIEREIDRQRLLELERAKTRELRHSLDMEKERQTQREIQRDLEQAESGIRTSRRDFSSHTSRPRERYRERDNARSGNEGSLRTSASSLQLETATSTSSLVSIPTVLSGSRPFSSGQPPTILQSRDRPEECSSSYEENVDGSKDSGDTGSIGDPELGTAFEGQAGGFGSAQRHGSRGSRSRQVMDRRERDGRREGKWERKNF